MLKADTELARPARQYRPQRIIFSILRVCNIRGRKEAELQTDTNTLKV